MSITYSHQGLPSGIRPFDLPDMLERLRTHLGLRDEDITYIRYLIRRVRAADFEPGRICAIWEAVATQAAELGFNVRRLARICCRLEELGFILKTTGKGGRRFGRRDQDGQIVMAAGVNLGPLIERAGDLAQLLQHQARISERLRDYRQRANDLIRSIRNLGVEQALLAARDIFPRLRPSEVNDVDRLSAIIEALEAVLEDFSGSLGRTLEAAGSDSSGRPNTNHEHKTKTCTAEKRHGIQKPSTTPEHVALLATSELRKNIEFYWTAQDQSGRLSWVSVLAAAQERAHQIGISRAFWQRQCEMLGPCQAALCLVIADRNSQRTDSYQAFNAAKAFAGMARKEARQIGVVETLLGELLSFSSGPQKRKKHDYPRR